MGRSTTTSSIRSTNSTRSTRSGRIFRSLGKARETVAGLHEVKTGSVPMRSNAGCMEDDWELEDSVEQDGDPAHIECEDMGRGCRGQGAGERPSIVHQPQLRMPMPTSQHQQQQQQALPNAGRPRSCKMSRSSFQEEIDSTPWRCGDQYNYRPPLQKDPWERCRSLTAKYDTEMCGSWKAEIDNILIFAGLFSASVTAFLIESYKWLQPDSGTYVSQLLTLTYESVSPGDAQEKLSALSDPFPQSTSERINIYWFLSLTLSLATVLVGIIATQWLREYQRDVLLSSKAELSLRQMRHEGLQYWCIPRIIAMLPLLLQCAFILFLLGILDLLWALNQRVAIPITIAVGLMLFSLAATIILPTLQFIFPGNDYLRVAQCAYKSPQSLAILRFVSGVLRLMPQRLRNSMRQHKTFERLLASSWHWSWTDFDLYWRETRDQGLMSKEVAPKSSEKKDSDDIVHALKWILKTFNQTTENITTVLQCINDLPLRVAIEVVRSKHWPCVLPETDVSTIAQCSDEAQRDILNVALMQRFYQTHESLRMFYWESQIRLMNTPIPRNILDWFSDHAFPKKLPDGPAMHLQLLKALLPLFGQGVASSTDIYIASLVVETSTSSRQHSNYQHHQAALDSHYLVEALETWLASPEAGQKKPLRDRILLLLKAWGLMANYFGSAERAQEACSKSIAPTKEFEEPMSLMCHDELPRTSDQPYQSASWPVPLPQTT